MFLILSGCSSSDQSTSDLFVMTSSGVGPLNAETVLTIKSLEKLRSGYLHNSRCTQFQVFFLRNLERPGWRNPAARISLKL